jgi:hypothetical protein
MFIKKLALISVIAVGALSATAGSAMAWDPADDYTFMGTLVSHLGGLGGPTLTCSTSFDALLDAGVTNPGNVTAGSATGCTSSTSPLCVPIVTFPTLNPGTWALTGSAATGNVTITGITFAVLYTGAGCPLAGLDITVMGDATGAYSAGTINFGMAGDTLAVLASNNTSVVPIGTPVDLVGSVTDLSGTNPTLE